MKLKKILKIKTNNKYTKTNSRYKKNCIKDHIEKIERILAKRDLIKYEIQHLNLVRRD